MFSSNNNIVSTTAFCSSSAGGDRVDVTEGVGVGLSVVGNVEVQYNYDSLSLIKK